MAGQRVIGFTGLSARIQYHLLMGLFRIALTRGAYGRFARGLGRIFSPRNAVYLGDSRTHAFKIYLNDGYWTRFGLYYPDYEPEVSCTVRAASGHTGLFLDLGANKGYWSVQAAPHFEKIIAVEASAETFQWLEENTSDIANVTRLKKAIHSETGLTLKFLNVPLSHASARIADAAEGADEEVETIRIDDLVPEGTAALVKLDVEGAEIPAIDGAARALQDGAVLIYEDHGNDPDCAPSAHLLQDDKISVYSISNPPKKLDSIAEIRALKTDPFKGYNFLAGRQDSTLLHAILQGLAKDKSSG